MKTLQQHIAESKALHQNVNITEKLKINKDFKSAQIVNMTDYENIEHFMSFVYTDASRTLSIIVISISLLTFADNDKCTLNGRTVAGGCYGTWGIKPKYDEVNQLVAKLPTSKKWIYYIFVPLAHIVKNGISIFDKLKAEDKYTPKYIDELFNISTYDYINSENGPANAPYELWCEQEDIEQIKKYISTHKK